MGQFLFLAPNPERLPPRAVERAYLAGMEGVPWQSRNREVDGQLSFHREISESGNLFMPWLVAGRGEVLLSTASLMERPRPYHLTIELARGALNRLRNQWANWKAAGLRTSPQLPELVQETTRLFFQAVTDASDAAESDAQRCIALTLDAIDLLAADYSQQVLQIRHQSAPKLATLLGCNTEIKPLNKAETEQFLATFNLAATPLCWKSIEENAGERDWTAVDQQIQWCRNQGLKVCAGPLLRIDSHDLPDWIYLWDDDFENIQSCVIQQVQAAVKRYIGSVHIWNCAAGLNLAGDLTLSEEQKLKLAVTAIDAVREVDRKAPLIITFDQPWAEYLRTEAFDLSPLHFADALIRADLGIAGIGLEINLGYSPRGSLFRDPLEFSQQIDRWAVLGLPLILFLTVPSSNTPDPNSRRNCQVHLGDKSWTPEDQRDLVERLVPLLISKQSVHGLVWSQRCDANPHEFPHGGLFDAQHEPKPALESLRSLREKHLN
ncbi:hypothetical protein [Lignipirellula cremea]|uniref:GH10 domain-containing protein n=1 Tax=Lignipirellula cremea TaxID=2528010 RepID=A0A518DZL3_9BACT|nr:hypothetical protein [Lignipirellula cremea]QDU97255.1 hypothetical protein Pla8534_51000 [Lignipirellula cremea]